MSNFNLKLSAKAGDQSDFKNFFAYQGSDFNSMNGKIVYMNSHFPGKHIFRPYYMVDGTAYPLTYMKNAIDREAPMLTLQDLDSEDYIVFYTSEDLKKIEEARKKKTP